MSNRLVTVVLYDHSRYFVEEHHTLGKIYLNKSIRNKNNTLYSSALEFFYALKIYNIKYTNNGRDYGMFHIYTRSFETVKPISINDIKEFGFFDPCTLEYEKIELPEKFDSYDTTIYLEDKEVSLMASAFPYQNTYIRAYIGSKKVSPYDNDFDADQVDQVILEKKTNLNVIFDYFDRRHHAKYASNSLMRYAYRRKHLMFNPDLLKVMLCPIVAGEFKEIALKRKTK